MSKLKISFLKKSVKKKYPKSKMRKIKIFIPKNIFKYHTKNIYFEGVLKNPRTGYCGSARKADWIFLTDRRHLKPRYKKFASKIIIFDFCTPDNQPYRYPNAIYFKHKMFRKQGPEKIWFKYSKPVYNIQHCLKSECLQFKDKYIYSRDIDISIFFNPSSKGECHYRERLASFIQKHFSDKYNIWVGVIGQDGKEGRSHAQDDYFKKMFQSKIIVTCGPNTWEGDYRLYEALFSGALVFSDRIYTEVTNSFIDYEHLRYYDRENFKELLTMIPYYLDHPKKRKKIGSNGQQFVLEKHLPQNRIDEVLKVIEERSKLSVHSAKQPANEEYQGGTSSPDDGIADSKTTASRIQALGENLFPEVTESKIRDLVSRTPSSIPMEATQQIIELQAALDEVVRKLRGFQKSCSEISREAEEATLVLAALQQLNTPFQF